VVVVVVVVGGARCMDMRRVAVSVMNKRPQFWGICPHVPKVVSLLDLCGDVVLWLCIMNMLVLEGVCGILGRGTEIRCG
jgi:hypothetical protein